MEYICARGTFQTASGMETGATACAHAIANYRGETNYYTCLKGTITGELKAACEAAKSKYSNWDYTRWACNKITPVVDTSITNGSSSDTCTWEIAYYQSVASTPGCGYPFSSFIESGVNICWDGVYPGASGGEADGGDECFLLDDRYFRTDISSSGGGLCETFGIPALICK